MAVYQKILVAIDLNEPSDRLKEVISERIAKGQEVQVCTAVVPIETMYAFVPVGGYSVALGGVQDELVENAQKGLKSFCSEIDLDTSNAHLLVGKASTEIKTFAEENNFDLIVVGTHGKGALRAALGSTSTGVLHGAPCDVLAVGV